MNMPKRASRHHCIRESCCCWDSGISVTSLADKSSPHRSTNMVPIELAAALFIAAAAISVFVQIKLISKGLRVYHRIQARHDIRCTTCGYSLIGNQSGICPECGSKIDWSIESPTESRRRAGRLFWYTLLI